MTGGKCVAFDVRCASWRSSRNLPWHTSRLIRIDCMHRPAIAMSLLSRLELEVRPLCDAEPDGDSDRRAGVSVCRAAAQAAQRRRRRAGKDSACIRPTVLDGEVWRLVTFLFDPPATNLIFAFFFWYLFYLMGTTLETSWGTFRYNVFLLIGYRGVGGGGICAVLSRGRARIMPASNGFLYGTVFLAFARLYPDFAMLHLLHPAGEDQMAGAAAMDCVWTHGSCSATG